MIYQIDKENKSSTRIFSSRTLCDGDKQAKLKQINCKLHT